MEVKPGIYVLSDEIWNPAPDRRCKDEWLKAPKWEKGWRFEILEDPAFKHPDAELKGTWYRLSCLENRNWTIKSATIFVREDGSVRLISDDERQRDTLKLMLHSLVPSTDPRDGFDFIFHEIYSTPKSYAEDLLYAFVKRGKITVDEVKAMIHEMREDYELPNEEFQKKWG